MTFIGETEFRKKFNIESDRMDDQILSAILSAQIELQTWVSDEVYEEAESEDTPTTAENVKRQKQVIESHTYLTAYLVAQDGGHRMSSSGFIEQSQVGSSPATTKTHTNRFLKQEDINKKAEMWLDRAKALVLPYALDGVFDAVTESDLDLSSGTLRYF